MFRYLVPAVTLIATSAITQDTGCRITERPASWSVVRNLAPYTGTEPLTRVRIDLCAYIEWRLGYENRTVDALPMHCSFDAMRVRIQASFEPNFTTPFFDELVRCRNVDCTHPSFDGVLDFDGTSGSNYEIEQSHFATRVDPVTNPGFFQSQYPIYIRSFAQVEIRGVGSYTAYAVPVSAAGVNVAYNP